MEIHLNVSFPRVPCELLTLDVMDVSGEQQVGVEHGVSKVRLASEAEGGRVIDVKALDLCVFSTLHEGVADKAQACGRRKSLSS